MKHSKLLFAFGAAFLSLTLLFSTVFRNLDGLLASRAVSADEREETVLILDAGHGGEDGGAVGVNGVAEKELNLALTRTLAAMLRAAGYSVVETRTDDRMLYSEDVKLGRKKQSDLANRLSFMTRYPKSLFVSIHMNTYPDRSCEGVQVWYAKAQEGSEALAGALQDAVRAYLQPDNDRQIKAAGSGIYLLHRAQTPAVLVECGFLSTPSECERLCDAAYRQQLALTLFTALSAEMRRV